MRLTGKVFLFLMLTAAFGACFQPPEFSNIPFISDPSVSFSDVDDISSEDSLNLTFSFKDGNGDIGFDDSRFDNAGPFANTYFFTIEGNQYDPFDENQNMGPTDIYSKNVIRQIYVRIPGNPNPSVQEIHETLLSYQDRNTPPYDTLPPFIPPYSCTNWQVLTDQKGVTTDTVYVQLNKNHYDIFVDILVADNIDQTKFTLYDFSREFTYPNCVVFGYNGRLPVLSADPSDPGPLEGKVQYALKSPLWTTIFKDKLMKLRFSIQDRALQKSNVLETPPFKLEDITINH